MTYEEALKAWVTHNPFKRATPELIHAIMQGMKNKEYAQEALV